MNEILLAITQRLAQQLPELQTIDIDWGQLDENAEQYPVFFPCALVDTPDIDWTKTGVGAQPGTAKISVKVGIKIPEDTHEGSGTTATALNRLNIAKLVNTALRLWDDVGFDPLERVKTRSYNLYGGIKVIELWYESEVAEM
jgi:hypothetical protein